MQVERSEHREKENAKRRERYAMDSTYREKRLAEGRAAYQSNPDPKKARNRQWWADNAEQGRQHRNKRRALERAAFVEYVSPLVVLERDDGVCGICGSDVDPFDFHVDHIVALVNGGWHAYDNVQTAHPACNQQKGQC